MSPQCDRADVQAGKLPRASIINARVSFYSSLHASVGNQARQILGPKKYGSSDTCHVRKSSFPEKTSDKIANPRYLSLYTMLMQTKTTHTTINPLLSLTRTN